MNKIEVIVQPIRGCGKRSENSMYLVTGKSSGDGCLPNVTVLYDPIPTQRKACRLPVTVDGSKIMAKRPESEWLIGSSASTAEKKAGDKWFVDQFGMPLAKRLRIGECVGCKTPEDALEILADRVCWSIKVEDDLREMTKSGLSEKTSIAASFMTLIRSIQEYVLSKNTANLVCIVGAVWNMYHSASPLDRLVLLRTSTSMLTHLGLPRDAIAMLKDSQKPLTV